MKNVVRMADMPVSAALAVFKILNMGQIKLMKDECGNRAIMAFKAPNLLKYPEGWYYAKGCFRNKHTSSTGIYHEVIMLMPNGHFWGDFATYCTPMSASEDVE